MRQLNYTVAIFAIALLLCLSNSCHALDGNSMKHAVVASTATAGLYIVYSGALGRGPDIRLPALFMSGGTVLAWGLAFEAMDAGDQNRPFNEEDMAINAAFTALSMAVIYYVDIKNVQPVPGGIAYRF